MESLIAWWRSPWPTRDQRAPTNKCRAKVKIKTFSIERQESHCDMQRPKEAFREEQYGFFCAKNENCSPIAWELCRKFLMLISTTWCIWLNIAVENYGMLHDIFGASSSQMIAIFPSSYLRTSRAAVCGLWSIHIQCVSP